MIRPERSRGEKVTPWSICVALCPLQAAEGLTHKDLAGTRSAGRPRSWDEPTAGSLSWIEITRAWKIIHQMFFCWFVFDVQGCLFQIIIYPGVDNY